MRAPPINSYTGISSEIGTKLRDWAIGQARAGCYSQAALSSNDSKTRYKLESGFWDLLLLSLGPHLGRRSRKEKGNIFVSVCDLSKKGEERREMCRCAAKMHLVPPLLFSG